MIGHSYGAKLLFDYYKLFSCTLTGIFISTANSILTPRLNNLKLDLAYLKKCDPATYSSVYQRIINLDLDNIWQISEELTPFFYKNKERPYVYWANLECYRMIKDIQDTINQPIDMNVFVSVRKALYSNSANYTVDINTLPTPNLWINGFHDFIMNGSDHILSPSENMLTFFKSAHYPHLEENDHFCEILNEFSKNS